MNWLIKILQVAPYVIAGIESLHKEKDSATKQQMAQDALILASGVSGALLPGESGPTVQAVAGSVSSLIDSIVGAFNATGVFSHKVKTA